ncbi:hypothetical protein [Salinisphaera sp. LB1]|uniref:hypothetical protein n=1 Tax=Salinisphaera sp. LB1 TaxID=2183911 RepID=UPI000D7065ED|nr:hypothetical protein [Salinisphaera sp. LB1]AWN14871.1 hypothetical protein SALB1_0664 [Salinisphaera sp. LB1]
MYRPRHDRVAGPAMRRVANERRTPAITRGIAEDGGLRGDTDGQQPAVCTGGIRLRPGAF